MKTSVWVVALSALMLSSAAYGCSFRVKGGDLVRCGMSKIEVMDKIGRPDMRNTESVGVNTGYRRGGRSSETWSYVTRGDIGGKYYVTVYFSGDKVVDIKSKQVR
ncbi:DUF2845 domain-containing protein [Pseudidiomarina sediminum]|uniref:DUF2845 domain-containing protein n=1 Tax=Pseudidiomarina sediminum TaxID=431675 RepID=A0A432Z8F9_9GAMM|nr:DUF2845 domain-containing protein [Pseudidiomarina sediminum]MBY6063332.1 DUF2845 domain-containing protein [Pseudidiomarina sediminum]RUO74176.1 DUF2845 domain-containing protein [Pseudidiomarina sediminum]